MSWPPIDSMWAATGVSTWRIRVVDVVNTAELGPVVYGVVQPITLNHHTYQASPFAMQLETFLTDYTRETS